MARITCHDPANLTGHAGPVPFRNGEGETSDPDLLALFCAEPDRFTVHEDETPAKPARKRGNPDD